MVLRHEGRGDFAPGAPGGATSPGALGPLGDARAEWRADRAAWSEDHSGSDTWSMVFQLVGSAPLRLSN